MIAARRNKRLQQHSEAADKLSATNDTTAAEIVSFWREAGSQHWFAQDEVFDQTIRARFLEIHAAALRGELTHWEESAIGALALLILLDQFSRNMFRGNARAFSSDALARAIAERALSRGFDDANEEIMRQFFYLPFMHSESLKDQERSLSLYKAYGRSEELKYAVEHRSIIAKFGRFPHRNQALNRVTTPAEQVFLNKAEFAE
jgi:uncharacterized protein (DUF924 family)